MNKFNYVPDNRVIFSGFYESLLYNSDSEYDFNYNEKDGFAHYMECEIDDFGAFCKDVCDGIVVEIGKYLVDDDICLSCTYDQMTSPKEYNFYTDRLWMNLDIDIYRVAFQVWYDEEMHKNFDEYLRRKYTSCDGFWSFVKNEIGDYFEEWEHLDVLVDYWLLTKIYGEKNIVKAIEKRDLTDYEYEIIDIADQCLYEHMVPISEVRYICDECRKDDKKQWVTDNARRPRLNYYGEDEIKEIFSDEELKARFYEENNVWPYDKHDNIN